MKLTYRQAASDDLVRQFRYHLVALNASQVAVRFRAAVRNTLESLGKNPLVGPHCRLSNPELQNLRSWPVTGFKAVRIYYLLDDDTIRVIRILHGKQDVKRILEQEKPSDAK